MDLSHQVLRVSSFFSLCVRYGVRGPTSIVPPPSPKSDLLRRGFEDPPGCLMVLHRRLKYVLLRLFFEMVGQSPWVSPMRQTLTVWPGQPPLAPFFLVFGLRVPLQWRWGAAFLSLTICLLPFLNFPPRASRDGPACPSVNDSSFNSKRVFLPWGGGRGSSLGLLRCSCFLPPI